MVENRVYHYSKGLKQCSILRVNSNRVPHEEKRLAMLIANGASNEEIDDQKENIKQMKENRFVVLSQTCDIKHKNSGFRGVRVLYTLVLYGIKECLEDLDAVWGSEIEAKLKEKKDLITNKSKKNEIERKIIEHKYIEALGNLEPFMEEASFSELKKWIEAYEKEKKMFLEIQAKKHNSAHNTDTFFFPANKRLGIKVDSVARFSVPNMFPLNECEVLGGLQSPFREALAQRFGTYFFRVPLPE